MRTTTLGVLILGLVATTACGGDEKEPAKAPPPPPTATMTPTPTPPPEPAAAPTPPKPSMGEMINTTSKMVADGINSHDGKKLSMAYAEDAVVTIPGMGELRGRDAIANNEQKVMEGTPDVKFAFSRAWVKGDMAAFEWVTNGTNSGEWNGMKATQKPVGQQGISLVWFNADGLVKQEHRYMDLPTMLSQMGVIPTKARAIPPMPGSMETINSKGTPEEDKNLENARSMTMAMDNRKEADFLGFVADDVTYDDMTQPMQMKGKKDAKTWFNTFTRAFPDMKSAINTSFAAGDYVIMEATMTGTHKGALGPLAPTNKQINIHGVDVQQWKDGKLVHGWFYGNSKEMLEQMGKWKMPAAKEAPKAGDKKAGTPAAATPPAATPPAGKEKGGAKK